ncbi:MAG: YjcQ family protein, partial [Tissierellia bacterium]|nr:YjcQ family protein [Tissierellia bacterium]
GEYMAKDDYFVIVYQILKYLYDSLKLGRKVDFIRIDYEHLEINEEYWKYIMINMLNSSFISGVRIIEINHGPIIKNVGIEITPKGIEYLFENNLIQKVKKTLKDIKDIAPFI